MKIIFFDIPCYPPPIAVRNSLTNQFFQENLRFCIISKKKIMQNWREEKGPGTLLFSSVLHNFFFWKFTESSIFLEKIIGQWIPDRNGQGIARDIKKNYFHFQNATKMVTKLRQFTNLGHFSFLNCPNFVPIFCQVVKMKTIFFDIPSYPPPIAVRNSLTNQFFQKKLTILYIFNKKKNYAKLKRTEGSFQLFKLSKLWYHVLSSFENGNIFLISLAIPRPLRSGIHWPINFSKKIDVSVYFQKNKLGQVYIGISILVIPDHMQDFWQHIITLLPMWPRWKMCNSFCWSIYKKKRVHKFT